MASKRLKQAIKNAKIIMQSVAPVNTGNLQQNGVQAIALGTIGKVYVSDPVAIYGSFLDKGEVPTTKKHLGWFSQKGYNAVAIYIEASNNGRKTNLRSAKAVVASNAPTTLARQVTYLRNIQNYKANI